MLLQSQAIILHVVKYGDRQLIVDMLTFEQGRVSFLCRLPTTSKGKLKKQLFQPLTLLEVVYDFRPAVRLQKLKEAHLSVPFISIPFDAVKLSVSLFLAEFLTYATRDEQRNEYLFRYVESSLRWLDGASTGFANFHLVFMMRLSRFIGFYPNTEDYVDGDVFDLREGRFSPMVPTHADFVSPADAHHLINLLRLTYPTMRLYTMSRVERNRCTDVILTYYRLHQPGFPELRSLDVLRELFV